MDFGTVELLGRWVTLRPLRLEDAPALDYVKVALARVATGHALSFVVLERSSGKVIGTTSYLDPDHENRRVEFKTDSLNSRSRRALLKLGAKEEGTLRNHMRTHSGRLRHSVYFSVTDEEWPGVKKSLEARLASGLFWHGHRNHLAPAPSINLKITVEG